MQLLTNAYQIKSTYSHWQLLIFFFYVFALSGLAQENLLDIFVITKMQHIA